MAWSRLILCVVSRGYRAFCLTLVVTAIVPTLWSWSGYLVRSGSMEPSIDVGDIVVAKPFDASETVPLGRVMIFPNQAKPREQELLVHRVVGDLGGGDYATAGDANATNDASPVTGEDLEARAVLLVPLVGRPVLWLQRTQLAPLVLWSGLTVLAFWYAGRRPSRSGGAGPGAAGSRPGRSPAHRQSGRLASAVTLLVAGGLAVSGTHSATASFTAQTRSGSSSWSVARAPAQAYTAQVLADSPYVYYQVDEASGPSMADSSGNARIGSYAAVAAYRQPGALPTNSGHSVGLVGDTGRLVTGGSAVQDPDVFSMELWFKTSSTAGGKLMGFESTRNATSPTFDRHVFMRPDGRLVYGGWAAQTVNTIVTPAAYNNGGWHHLVVTAKRKGQQQESVIYVDGHAVAAGTTSRTGFYSGWWRVGYGSLGTGPGYPASANFTGNIDQVAIYQTELSAARVASHWAAR